MGFRRFLEILSEYNFDISYIKGTLNKLVEALRYIPHIYSMIPSKVDSRECILDLSLSDKWYAKVSSPLQREIAQRPKFDGYCNTPVLTLFSLNVYDVYIVLNHGVELQEKSPPWIIVFTFWRLKSLPMVFCAKPAHYNFNHHVNKQLIKNAQPAMSMQQ